MSTESSKRKCMTAKDVQEEYLDMDIRKIRVFLNTNLHYKKIGRRYFYARHEVESLLLDESKKKEFTLKEY